MKNSSEPAFPLPGEGAYQGLTKREWAAVMIAASMVKDFTLRGVIENGEAIKQAACSLADKILD